MLTALPRPAWVSSKRVKARNQVIREKDREIAELEQTGKIRILAALWFERAHEESDGGTGGNANTAAATVRSRTLKTIEVLRS